MKTKLQFILIAIVAILMSSCMQSPQGDKAKTSDVYEIKTVVGVTEFKANLEQSKVEWLGTKPTGTHWGDVKISSGTVHIKDRKIVGGKMVIDLNSIRALDLANTDMEAKLVGHLKSADFFHVDSFPTATFEIAEISELKTTPEAEAEIKATHEVKGNLTMRGTTKGIVFNAKIEVSENEIIVKSNQFFINRTLWKVNYGSKSIFAELKDNFIHDEMGINIDFRAEK